MDRIIIRGRKTLTGEIEASGAKNAALPILAASLLCNGPVTIENVPNLADVSTIVKLLEHLGATVTRSAHEVRLEWRDVTGHDAPYDLVRTMRASVLALGPLAARVGRARVSLPGGCAIGSRPIDLHLVGLEKMGAKVRIEHGYVLIEAERLRGAAITLAFPTVTGTENLMMAASLAEGTTVIENAAKEPEVADLAEFLNRCGAKVSGHGTDRIRVEGVPSLTGCAYPVMPDRIETGTFLVAGAITGGDVTVSKCVPDHLTALIEKLQATGLSVETGKHSISVRSRGRTAAVDVTTLPYPGFPTDMQAQMMALLCVSSGSSVVEETVFESRFGHVSELHRMGADIRIQGSRAVIQGVNRLSGAPIMASDLRASAGLILAGLAAEGETVVSRVYHLDRGYEHIEQKLSALGADISRVSGQA